MPPLTQLARGMVCLSLMIIFTGCTTYRSQQVTSCKKYKGIPVNVEKTYLATVSWSTGPTTQHVCILPAIFAVDVVAAPMGTTHATMKLEKGKLTHAEAELDQKIPEIITAIGDAAADIAPLLGGAREGSAVFNPPLDSLSDDLGYVVAISFQPLD